MTTDPETLLLLLWRRRRPDEAADRLAGGPDDLAALGALLAGPVTA